MTPTQKILVAASATLLSLSSQAAIVFDFSTGAQGWTANSPEGLLLDSSGGALRIQDGGSGNLSAVAPVSALGDWSSYLGGAISFDARNENISPTAISYWSEFGQITLRGGNGVTLVVDAVVGQPAADGSWQSFSVDLGVATWEANLPAGTLAGVLANVVGFEISGEFQVGITEIVNFDNIRVSAPGGGTVPEPATWALGLAALGAAAMVRRRRR